MNAAAGRICGAASVAASRHCRLRRKVISAATAAMSPRTAVGSRFVRQASSATTLPDGDVLYLPMPKLSPSMTRATVTKWLKAEGDEINEYDAILELSTDSLYAPGDAPVEGGTVDMIVELAECGFVGKLFVAEGDTVEVGQAVMAMCEEEENVRALSGATSPGVDCYGGAGEGLRIATYQGYLNHKTPAE
ncbi:unnamed protein product [Ectocarpus sp. 12 AP-2014]